LHDALEPLESLPVARVAKRLLEDREGRLTRVVPARRVAQRVREDLAKRARLAAGQPAIVEAPPEDRVDLVDSHARALLLLGSHEANARRIDRFLTASGPIPTMADERARVVSNPRRVDGFRRDSPAADRRVSGAKGG